MTILGIETSTAVCSVGITSEFGLQLEKSIFESHIHSEKILTLIQELCDEHKTKLSQLDGVAVSIGPGSFTGLRIGLSTAKGLCFALEKPIIPVPTYESIAKSVAMSYPECTQIIVCIDAKQREYYIGMYKHSKGTVREMRPVQIGSLSSAVSAADLKTVIVTDSINEMEKEAVDSIIVKDVFSHCRGDVIARLAIEKWNSGGKTVLEQLEPMYLKDFIVLTKLKLEK